MRHFDYRYSFRYILLYFHLCPERAIDNCEFICFHQIYQGAQNPLPTEARQAFFAREQFLHGAFFVVAFFYEELLNGFHEGIHIVQRLGNGFLFGYCGRECYDQIPKVTYIEVLLGKPALIAKNLGFPK